MQIAETMRAGSRRDQTYGYDGNRHGNIVHSLPSSPILAEERGGEALGGNFTPPPTPRAFSGLPEQVRKFWIDLLAPRD